MNKNLSDGKNVKKLKDQIQKHLTEGKSKLIWLENLFTGEKNQEKIKTGFDQSKEKFITLKKRFVEFEEKAVHYTEKNPKKALAIAGAAGLLVGTLWNSFQKKTVTIPKKALPFVSKRPKQKK